MIIPVMAISNLVLTQQIYSEETNGAHAHNRDRVPLKGPKIIKSLLRHNKKEWHLVNVIPYLGQK